MSATMSQMHIPGNAPHSHATTLALCRQSRATFSPTKPGIDRVPVKDADEPSYPPPPARASQAGCPPPSPPAAPEAAAWLAAPLAPLAPLAPPASPWGPAALRLGPKVQGGERAAKPNWKQGKVSERTCLRSKNCLVFKDQLSNPVLRKAWTEPFSHPIPSLSKGDFQTERLPTVFL